MSNIAQDVLIPDPGTFRTVFLYVGQGEATLLVIPEGENFKFVLIDTNVDKKNGGIDMVSLLSDLLGEEDELVFINTHPHTDHIVGIKEISDAVKISEVWHSGHIPGSSHDDAYQELKDVIDEIGDENEYILFGTNDINKIRESDQETEIDKPIGDVDFQVLSPAEYVQDDVDGEDPDTRYQRIHERCGIIKYTYGGEDPKHILLSGDSDKTAWEEHVTDYHSEVLPSNVLSASHHGSRTFFKNTEDDEEYRTHIDTINPDYLVISAPTQEESKHDHPHDDALEIYQEYVEEDNIFHLGENRECVIVDITTDGDIEVRLDQDLAEEYGYTDDDKGGGKGKRVGAAAAPAFIGSRTSRIDDQPMGDL